MNFQEISQKSYFLFDFGGLEIPGYWTGIFQQRPLMYWLSIAIINIEIGQGEGAKKSNRINQDYGLICMRISYFPIWINLYNLAFAIVNNFFFIKPTYI